MMILNPESSARGVNVSCCGERGPALHLRWCACAHAYFRVPSCVRMCGLYASALAVLQLLIGKRCELPDMPVCFAHISGAVSGLLVGFGDRVTLHGCSRRGFVHKLNIFVRARIAASSLLLSLLGLRCVH